MATILTRSFGEQGNQKKFTISVWVKRCNLASYNTIFSSGSGAYATRMYFDGSTGQFDWWNYFNSAYQGRKTSNARYRDTNGYYHIVCRYDSASSTASERMRMYINGEQVTSLATSSDPNQNQTQEVGHTGTHYIGGYSNSADFDGLMSHYHYCDNYSYAPTEFGETDSTTGEWKIKTSPSVSYGTTGFFILKDGNSVTDQSGLSHNWTVGSGTLTKTEDCPDNVFATWNANLRPNSTASFAYGNTKQTTNSSHQANVTASGFTTLGMTKGKFYAEFKVDAVNWTMLGVSCDIDSNQQGSTNSMYNFIYNNKGFAYYSVNGNCYHTNSNTSVSYGNSYTTNDIIGIALDLDNYKLYFSKNGVWQNSGDPTSGSTGTGSTQSAGTITLPTFTGDNEYFFCHADFDQSAQSQVSANFGNGYFGTTAVSSAGTNASGNGIFEYDVPTGYTALSTKGLNT